MRLAPVALCAALVTAASLPACEKGKSNVPLVQEADAPFDEHARARADRDGKNLRWRDYAMHLAVNRGLKRARAKADIPLLPIAEVDDRFNSASVTFYRWLPRDMKDGQMRPDRASRWLVVPMLLKPDRVLENEQHSDYVEKNSPIAHEIHAVIAAGEWAQKEAQGTRWHMHTVREGPNTDGSYKNRTRVYAMSTDGSGPDLEFLFSDVKNDESPLLLGKTVVHEAGAWAGDEIKMSLPGPTAMTVARVLEKELLAQQVIAHGSDGSKWSIDSESGKFELLEAGTPPPSAEEDGGASLDASLEVDASVEASVDASAEADAEASSEPEPEAKPEPGPKE
jgi:hypothetical protein